MPSPRHSLLQHLPIHHSSCNVKAASKSRRVSHASGLRRCSVPVMAVGSPSCPTLWSHMDRIATRLLCPWDLPGKHAGVGYHFLLQGVFQTRDWTHVSYVAGGFLTPESPEKPVIHLLQATHEHSVRMNCYSLDKNELEEGGVVKRALEWDKSGFQP